MSGFPDYFSAAAAGYAVHRPTYPPELAEFLASRSKRRECAWDCGTGSGQLAATLAAHFAEVVATDASAEQLARATPHPRIRYRRASAEASGLPATSIDLAVAAQAVHWFDLPAYVAEIRRVARPGALVAWIGYGHAQTGDAAIDQVLQDFHSGVLTPYWPPERAHVDDGYRNLPFPFTPVATPHFDIQRSWTVAQFLDYVRTWSALRRLEGAGDLAAFETFTQALTAAWGAVPQVRGVRWPIVMRAGTV